MKHDVVYIPGIGDTKTTFQELAVKSWRLWGVRPHTFAIRWADGQPLGPKFERLLADIDELLAQGHQVSLVGASAGASVAVHAYTARPQLHGVVCIAGKLNYAYDSVTDLSSAQRQRMSCRYGIVDVIVPRRYSIIPGAQNKTVLGFSHVMTIALQLTIAAPNHLRFLRKLKRAGLGS